MSLSAPFKPITLGIIGCFASVWAAPGAEGILGALMSLCMLGICICDSRRFIIPNKLVAAAFVLAMVDAALGATGSLWMALALPLGRSLATAGGLIVFMKSYAWRFCLHNEKISCKLLPLFSIIGYKSHFLRIKTQNLLM